MAKENSKNWQSETDKIIRETKYDGIKTEEVKII